MIKSEKANNFLKIDGDIYFSNATQILAELSREIQKLKCPTIDMSALSNCDSAGVALLIELKKQQIEKGCSIHFINPPQQLLMLSKFLKVDEILFKQNT